MLQQIERINQAVNNFVWGVPAMVCILGVGLYLSIRMGFVQIREFPYAMKCTLGRMFKKQEGISILEYITNERIAMAQVLIRETDYTIYQVADRVGYPNYSYFSRVYKKMTGKTPQEYKKEF